MRAPTEPFRRGIRALALGLAVLGAASPAWGRGGSPFRLAVPPGDYRLRLPREAAPPRPAPGATAAGLGALVERHARARNLDPALVHALIRAESAYRPQAVSPKGAQGLMQVMPDTGRRFGVTDLLNPESNLRAGTAYLSYLLDYFGDLSLALAAYNAGEGAVIRHGYGIPPYPETRAYVRNVLGDYGKGRAAAGLARHRYLDGAWLERRDLSAYRLRP